MSDSVIVDHNGIPYQSSSDPYSLYGRQPELSNIGMYGCGPNTEAYQSLKQLRNTSRKFVGTNTYAAGAAKSFSSNMVGSGIRPRWQIKDYDLKQRLQDLWDESITKMNFIEEKSSFYSDQSHAANDIFSSGEVFIRFVYQKRNLGLPVPFQYQMLESDYCDENYDEFISHNRRVKMGIELDKYGRRTAYHLFKEHPNDIFATQNVHTFERQRIPKKHMLHIGIAERRGQLRYKPWLTPALLRLWQIDNAVHNELERRKTVALFGGVIKQHYGAAEMPNMLVDNPPFADNSDSSSKVPDKIKIPQGSFVKVPAGYDLQVVKQEDIAGSYIDFMDNQLKSIATGISLTYEQFSKDLSGVTYSSIRAGMLEFRRTMRMLQRIMMIEPFCQPVLEAWLNTAVISGAIQIDDFFHNPYKYYNVLWQPEPWAWIEPQHEQKAEKEGVRNGTITLSQLASERGTDIESILHQTAETNQKLDELGVVLDSDPRKTTANGMLQSTGEKEVENE